MEAVVFLWNELIIRPMLNTLMVLYVICFQQMGIAIILFTLLVRTATMPLTLKQIRQMRVMSVLQPKMKEIQERYRNDRSRVSQETMRMYKEAGVNPIGCLGPLIVQMPILIGLFRVLIQTLFSEPDNLVGLSQKLYTWIPIFPIHSAAPLTASFLGLDLSAPDPTRVIIPALVFVSTWVQQKLTIMPSSDPKQQTNQTMMLWMMPVMIAVFSLQFPAGLSLYWIVSNVIGVAVQYVVTPKGQLPPLLPLFPKPAAAPPQAQPTNDAAPQEMGENGSTRNERPNRRRSNRVGAERARRRPRRGRGRNTK
ncbi:MAG: membrane protein insertase YidC [Chloroflexi bacterium]|nr:membrane protein insertase YidC [Chloroflexota bacterium]MCH8349250.1 membrane protein insertase YidC [Chloroflexota bacterium]MCI0780874.1 membrane protein insertase YidC [Chloroflexota bacterium]MCI0786194.1 membrane protein insertase YidC [Chloroflexota bacterium]MCI0858878.1 membrane protein insertase YidC [Chloroflexota bacterium]